MSDKEREDGIVFNSLDTCDISNDFFVWNTTYVKPEHLVFEIAITVPEVCSDGVVRSPEEYVLFTSGKSLDEHIEQMKKYNKFDSLVTIKIVYVECSYGWVFRIIVNQ